MHEDKQFFMLKLNAMKQPKAKSADTYQEPRQNSSNKPDKNKNVVYSVSKKEKTN